MTDPIIRGSSELTPEQRGRERALLVASMLDGGMVVLLFLGGIGGQSLTCLAEAIRGGLMAVIDVVTLLVIRRIHRGALRGFDYGTGKIEQLCSIAVACGLFGGAVWVAYDALAMALMGHSDASPLGLAAAAVVAALNLLVNFVAWDGVRRATLGSPSAIMRAQLHARVTKLTASLLVQVTMTVAALAKDLVLVALADGLGAVIVSAVMVKAGIDLMVESVPDLLDRSAAHVAGPALERAAASLPSGFGLAGFRSRGTSRAFALEVAVTCPEGAGVRAVGEIERQLTADLAAALPGVELSVSIRATLA
jgi:divalent metal cation (Fe/Co/Zn/Cd) transporter